LFSGFPFTLTTNTGKIMTSFLSALWRRPLGLLLSLSILFAVLPAKARPQPATTASTILAVGGLIAFNFAELDPHAEAGHALMPAVVGTSALLCAALSRRHYLKDSVYSIRDELIPAAIYLGGNIAFDVMRSQFRSHDRSAPVTATLCAGGAGMLSYMTVRLWGPIRESHFGLHVGDELPPIRSVLPRWFGEQLAGNLLDLSSQAYMHGLAYSAIIELTGHDDEIEHHYGASTTLLDFVARSYAVTAAGNAASAVCFLGMTYAFPVTAGLPGMRLPCHLLNLGAHVGMRAALAYMDSDPGEDWRDRFWQREAWNLPYDAFASFMQYRWWKDRASAYPNIDGKNHPHSAQVSPAKEVDLNAPRFQDPRDILPLN
jgi:hypothetical protein